MSVWAKVLWNGDVSIGPTVSAPGYFLDEYSEPVDGWQKFSDENAALSALAPSLGVQEIIEIIDQASSIEEVRDIISNI